MDYGTLEAWVERLGNDGPTHQEQAVIYGNSHPDRTRWDQILNADGSQTGAVVSWTPTRNKSAESPVRMERLPDARVYLALLLLSPCAICLACSGLVQLSQ